MRIANPIQLFGASIAILMAGSASAADWQRVGSTTEIVSYIDKSTIQISGRYVMAWTKWVFLKPQKSGVVEQKSRDAYDCANQKTRLVAAVSYGSSGRVIETFEWSEYESQFKSVAPETIAAAALEEVCSSPKSPPEG